MRRLLLGCAATLALAGSVHADETLGAWSVSETTSPLTNATTITARVDSTLPLANQIGQPEKASLIIRCGEGVPAFYVTWPQVLSHDAESVFFNLPETLVLYKLDDQKIKSDFWVISDNGTAGGSFDAVGAPRLISMVQGAHTLVVRMSGQGQQDAVFPLDGVDQVVAKVGAACGLRIKPPVVH